MKKAKAAACFSVWNKQVAVFSLFANITVLCRFAVFVKYGRREKRIAYIPAAVNFFGIKIGEGKSTEAR